MFGPHLTLDMYNCDEDKISDKNFIFDLLDELPEKIGMHKISKPQLIFYPGKESSFDKGGISGFILIAESHISIHTFIEQKFASIDIFSCKSFDVEKAVKIVMDKLGAEKVEKHFIMRGREFPRDVDKVKTIMIKEREKRR